MTPTIVFDFDGTLALGSGPVIAYARLVAAAAEPGFLERAEEAVAAFEAGDSDRRDGYDVVGTLALAEGVSTEVIGAAYQGSREQLGTPDAPVDAMPGLRAFLDGLRRHARVVLATNAPQTGIDRVLDAWDARDAFDALHFTVGKPAGLTAVIRDALADGPVLAVGDIVENDLAPASALGADTALVGATASTSPAEVTFRGATLADIRGDIETWAATAARTAPASNGAASPNER